MDIGKSIKLCRTIKGLKQKALAGLAGISVSYLSLIERGKRDPNVSRVEKIAKAMGISLMVLLFLGKDDDLTKIDPELSERMSADAFRIIREAA